MTIVGKKAKRGSMMSNGEYIPTAKPVPEKVTFMGTCRQLGQEFQDTWQYVYFFLTKT